MIRAVVLAATIIIQTYSFSMKMRMMMMTGDPVIRRKKTRAILKVNEKIPIEDLSRILMA